jgi:hypothetical protein
MCSCCLYQHWWPGDPGTEGENQGGQHPGGQARSVRPTYRWKYLPAAAARLRARNDQKKLETKSGKEWGIMKVK